MNWDDERYVRLYVRNTADLIAIGYEGRIVLYDLMRNLDRAGVSDLGADLELLPRLLDIPAEVVSIGLRRLQDRGVIQINGKYIVMPNFLAAQEAKQSDRMRQEESRARRRDIAHAKEVGVTIRDAESQDVTGSHETQQNVTTGHTPSQTVTDGHSVPIRAVPSVPTRAVPSTRGRAGSTEQGSLPGVPEPPPNEDSHAGWPDIQDAWWRGYREMTGKDPAPNKRQWGQLKRVLHDRANGNAVEVIRRIRILFASPPKFLAGSPPDFATLEEHWEKLAVPSGSVARPTPDDLGVDGLLRFADEWERLDAKRKGEAT